MNFKDGTQGGVKYGQQLAKEARLVQMKLKHRHESSKADDICI